MIHGVKTKRFNLDGKFIDVFDGALSFAEVTDAHTYAEGSLYRPKRAGGEFYIGRYQTTLRSSLSVTDICNFNFFKNEFVLEYMRTNGFRVRDAYINLCTASDVYRYHVDTYDEKDGCRTLLCYLNHEWMPEWEGETHFSDQEAKDILVSCAFIPGRIIVFDSTIPHKSSQPGPTTPAYRYVLVLKLVQKHSPGWREAVCLEDLKFRSDVQLTDRERVAASYLSEATGCMPHSGSTLFSHLMNTFYILKNFGLPEKTCLAGMFHSIYGTESYQLRSDVSEDKIIDLIGNEANDLVKIFSQPNRYENIVNNRLNLNKDVRLALLHVEYANAIEQARRVNEWDYRAFGMLKSEIDHHIERG